LRALAAELATALDARLGVLAEGANAAGAWLAGAVPAAAGRDAGAMLAAGMSGYVLLGTEPWADSLQPGALQSLRQAGFVVALTPYSSAEMKEVATLLLPVGTFAETSGTYVNLAGTWQSFAGAAVPVGEARPAWKVLRVLGNLLGLEGFEQQSSEDVRDQLRAHPAAASDAAPGALDAAARAAPSGGLVGTPIYQEDPLVRRAPALQRTRMARAARGGT
jgi:NADH-quinone oxidoreductase subunit G